MVKVMEQPVQGGGHIFTGNIERVGLAEDHDNGTLKKVGNHSIGDGESRMDMTVLVLFRRELGIGVTDCFFNYSLGLEFSRVKLKAGGVVILVEVSS